MLPARLFVGAGIAAFRALPVEAFPDVTDIQVTVITLFPGHAPEEVEKQVTIPLEIALSGLPNSVRMFSHTQFGLSFLIVTFDDKCDRLLRAAAGARAAAGRRPAAGVAAAARAAVDADRRDLPLPAAAATASRPTELRTHPGLGRRARSCKHDARRRRRRQLRRLHQAVRGEPSTSRSMKSYNVTLQQVFTALGRGNANAGGSYLEQGEQQYLDPRHRPAALAPTTSATSSSPSTAARRCSIRDIADGRGRRRAAPGHRRPGRRRRDRDAASC